MSQLEQLLRDNGLGWAIDQYAPPDGAIPYLTGVLTRTTERWRARGLPPGVEFTPENLAAEARRHSLKVRAFLQALVATRSPEMLVMAWLIIQGMTIRVLALNHEVGKPFRLRIELASPYSPGPGEPPTVEVFESNDIRDAAILRYLGPRFDSFYPLRFT